MKISSSTLIAISLCILLICCTQDDLITDSANQDTPPEVDIHLLDDEILWQTIIDTNLFVNLTGLNCTDPIIHNNLIIWYILGKAGFIAYDRHSGQKLWDNFGKFNSSMSSLSSPLAVVDNRAIFITNSRVRIFNLDTGNIEYNELYGDNDEFFGSHFSISNNTMYSSIKDYPDANKSSAFAHCSVDELEEKNWQRVNTLSVSQNDGFMRRFKVSDSYLNNNNERIFISRFGETEPLDYNNRFSSILSYNIDADSVIWKHRGIGSNSGGDMIREDDKIYLNGATLLFCLDRDTGEELWRQEFKGDHLGLSAGILLYQDILIGIGHAEAVMGVDKNTGQVLWEKQLNHANYGDTFFDISGSEPGTANTYNDRIYYVSKSGSLVSLNPLTGDLRRFYLPERETNEEFDVKLYELGFNRSHMAISDDGIIYASDGLRITAFEVPDAEW